MKKSFRNFVGAVWLLLLLLSSSALFAQSPRTMSYQGVLTDQSGKMFGDGSYRISVRLYDDVASSTPLFAEEHNVVVSNGVFNITIGSVSAIPATVLFDKTYYLGVSVNDGQELTPRTVLTSVPYAMRSNVADMAAGVAPNAKGVVNSLNGTQGDLIIKGDGATTVTQKGNIITIGTPLGIPGKGGNSTQVVPNNVTFSGDLTNTVNTNNSTWMVNIGNGKVTTDRIGSSAVTTAKISSSGSTAGQVLTSLGASGVAWADPSSSGATGAASGDLSGDYPNPSVVALRGIAISNSSPSAGNALLYNGSMWAPGTTVTNVSVNTANGVSGAVTNSTSTPAITLTLGAITPSSVAATGTVTGSNLSGTNTGDVTIGTANGLSLAGQVLSLGTASASQAGALSASDWSAFDAKESAITAGTSGQYWRGDKTWQTLSSSAVAEGTNLYYTDARARAALSNTATGLSYNSSTGATSLTSGYVIPTTTEQSNWNDANSKKVSSWTSPLQYSAGTASILQSSAVTNGYLSSSDWTTFNNKQSTSLSNGTVWVGNASGVATAVTPSGDVSMSNLGVVTIGTGAVTSAKILDGTVANADLATGIDAAKIGAGTVSNTELGYVDGVTSAIQTQLDDKVAKNASITAGTKTKITYDAKGLVSSGADATTDDITEGSANLYFSNTRARTALSNTATGLSYNSSTGATSLTSGYVIPQTDDVLPSQSGNNGKYLTTNGVSPSWTTIDISAIPVGGDLTGTAGNATVSKINNAALGTTTATNKNILVADGSSWNSVAVSGDMTISNGGVTTISNSAVSTAKIADDAVTSAKILDGTIVNADISASAAIDDAKLATISTSGKVANSATTATASNTASTIVSRDASGNFSAGTISAALAGTASNASALDNKTWEVPGTIGSTTPNSAAFTTVTAALPAAAGTNNRLVTLNGSNAMETRLAGSLVLVGDITGTLATSTIGTGAVNSAKIADGSVANIDLAAGIDAAKIGAGTVSNTEFGYVAGVTSAVQTQLNNRVVANSSITGATKTKITYDSKGLVTSGADATTSDITEGTRLYYTDERARLALSNTVTGLSYDNTTGVTSLASGYVIPTTTQETNWNTAYTSRIDNYLSPLIYDGSSKTLEVGIANATAEWDNDLGGYAGGTLGVATFVASDFDDDGNGRITLDYSNGRTASASVKGFLSSADWTTFNNKQSTSLSNGSVWVGNASGVATAVTPSGDVSMSNLGVVTIGTDAVTSAKILDGTVANADLATGIDATKIGVGTVSNTELGYVDGVTSAIQTQLDDKVAKNSSITAGTKTKITYDSKGLVTGGADATTSDIAEGSNLYYTDARARTALSNTATGLSYDNTSGVTSLASGYIIPTTTDESNWNDANSKKVSTWTSPLQYSAGTASILQSSAVTNGYLSSSDWTTFNNKQSTSLSNGSVWVGNASGVATAVTPSGDVSMSNLGVVTIGTGAVTSAKILDGTIDNADISGSAAIADTKLATISTSGKVSNSATTATSANTVSTIVSRDASGNFSAGTITATLSGNATNVSGTVAIANGGTGATTANGALNALLPSQSGQSGKFLKSDGSNTSWTTVDISGSSVGGDLSGTVSNATINNAAVTSAKIADGTIVNDDISATAAIAATKIAGGLVDNTEFGYLNGLTGSINTSLANRWNTAGNALNGTEFLGSTNSEDLVFKTDGEERFKVLSTGEIVVANADLANSIQMEIGDGQGTTPLFKWEDDGTILGLIDASGNMGIGTSSPLRKLHVAVSGGGPAAAFEGQVGFGTTNPEALVHIENTAEGGATQLLLRYTPDQDGTPLFTWQDADGNTLGGISGSGNFGIGIDDPNVPIEVAASQAVVASFHGKDASAGNVGFGTLNPSAQVHVFNETTNLGFGGRTSQMIIQAGEEQNYYTDENAVVQSNNVPLLVISDSAGQTLSKFDQHGNLVQTHKKYIPIGAGSNLPYDNGYYIEPGISIVKFVNSFGGGIDVRLPSADDGTIMYVIVSGGSGEIWLTDPTGNDYVVILSSSAPNDKTKATLVMMDGEWNVMSLR